MVQGFGIRNSWRFTTMVQQRIAVVVAVARRRGEEALTAFLTRLVAKSEEGVVMVEYAILAAVIAVALLATIQALEAGIAGVFTRIVSSISGIG